MNQETRNIIHLAGLLHDIGKFYQRADDNGASRSRELSPTVKSLEPFICPKSGSSYSHKHVLWTVQFIEDIKSSFLGISERLNELHGEILRIAAYHHKPTNFYESIIQEADHLSAGVDRTNEKGLIDEKLEKNWDSFKRVKMVPIFEGISKGADYEYKFEIPVLNEILDNSFFPRKRTTDFPDYKKLWTDFIEEFNFIQTRDLKSFSETLLSLLGKYTSAVPSSIMHLPDVSLFDHLKTSAALSVCLYDFASEKGIKDITLLRSEKAPVVLIGADVSGIQNYLYSIPSKNASKNLKGRSFYIQLLCESIIRKLIGESGLNLYSSNIVYNSGGGFYILAPNTNGIKDKLMEIRSQIESAIFNHHGTNLFVAIDFVEVERRDFFEQAIHNCWRQLFEKLNSRKFNRYSNLLSDDYNRFFGPIGTGLEERDIITGEIIEKNEKKQTFEEGKIKDYTAKQIEIGKLLNKARYWILSEEELNIGISGINVCELGTWSYLLDDNQFDKTIGKIKDYHKSVTVFSLNSHQFLDKEKGKNNIYSYMFYGGNNYPVNADLSPKTFDELCEETNSKEESKQGFTRLGVLRMDVDNLGSIFQSGFTNNKKTFSRYSSLSRNLDFFFRGYINKIWNQDKYNKNTYIIYSGGDDLFIVGKWDLLIDLAHEIRQQFNEWTTNSPDLTISGGITLVTPKYPVLRAAEEAGYAEQLAKNYRFNGLSKNAFTLFNYALHWENELPFVEKLKNRISELIENNTLPRSFIAKIMQYYSRARFKDGKIGELKILWLTAYDMGRMAKRYENKTVTEFLNEIMEGIYTNHFEGEKPSPYHFLELLYIACRWSELELR